jgi:hypothetical protein
MISRELELLREQWREVATDLNILFLAPYELPLSNGRAWEFAGLLPQFGSVALVACLLPRGTQIPLLKQPRRPGLVSPQCFPSRITYLLRHPTT